MKLLKLRDLKGVKVTLGLVFLMSPLLAMEKDKVNWLRHEAPVNIAAIASDLLSFQEMRAIHHKCKSATLADSFVLNELALRDGFLSKRIGTNKVRLIELLRMRLVTGNVDVLYTTSNNLLWLLTHEKEAKELMMGHYMLVNAQLRDHIESDANFFVISSMNAGQQIAQVKVAKKVLEYFPYGSALSRFKEAAKNELIMNSGSYSQGTLDLFGASLTVLYLMTHDLIDTAIPDVPFEELNEDNNEIFIEPFRNLIAHSLDEDMNLIELLSLAHHWGVKPLMHAIMRILFKDADREELALHLPFEYYLELAKNHKNIEGMFELFLRSYANIDEVASSAQDYIETCLDILADGIITKRFDRHSNIILTMPERNISRTIGIVRARFEKKLGKSVDKLLFRIV